ncbi:MAG: DUF499 domain-containing protein [Desulfovibrionaceae bacterium]|nr:DUF499 domain-containing protein [Desulfovibrionaceae bacterium]
MSLNHNHTAITQGFQLLLQALSPYITQELHNVYGSDWWNSGVLAPLYDDQKRNLPVEGSDEELAGSLDIYLCLLLLDLKWNDIFRKKLPTDCRSWIKELTGVRNRWAHAGSQDINDDDTWRALDTMSRLCDHTDAETAEKIRSLLRMSRYGSAAGSIASSQVQTTPAAGSSKASVLSTSPANLPCWRTVIQPHPDVAQGRYRNAEFAADLAQVARGEGSFEYRDPVEFFARTYVTEGIKNLLVQALQRVTGNGGEPVIQLKTAFGGGKTHSMLALYHLLRGKVPAEKMPNVQSVLEEACVSSLPPVHVAVLVGTALNPAKGKNPQNLPGITIHTLWGEIAAQLVLSTGNPLLYDFVREADKKGVSPGSEAMTGLFNACGSCLILIDELVAYAKRIYGVNNLPAGSFDNFISFIQELTEAAKASKSSLVVASIPESEIEVGGEAGRIALEAIEHHFGRMEAIWKPVVANEGFEIVRRRLFLDCQDTAARDLVCNEFSNLYRENPADFPVEAKEVEYKNRLIACYPIHPEVFDRLYEDWATLERFQRTRGILRLMAAVIHELWMANDAGLLIMPGSLPLSEPSVRDELTRHLPDGWNSVMDKEVDGKNSLAWQQDKGNSRYGSILASRRVSRTIMLGSAPSVRQQNVRGIETARIRLGTVQPGEQIATFNDALGSLQSRLAYLYTNSSQNRFWYDTRPTLRKTMEDRASQFSQAEVENEIENRLKRLRKREPFAGVHICPASSLDVPDEQAVRLVVMRPADSFTENYSGCCGMKAIQDIFEHRGQTPRSYKNMLVFLAPDQVSLSDLQQDVRHLLAWQSIRNDSLELNLDAAQNQETATSLKRCNDIIEMRMKETWCWLVMPEMPQPGLPDVDWKSTRMSGSSGDLIENAGQKLLDDENIITKWGPALLVMELDNFLWGEQDCRQIKKLWEEFCKYCYLTRLASYAVLEQAVQDGVAGKECFAYAEGHSDGRYIGLRMGEKADVDKNGFLVKLSAAQKQLQEEAEARKKDNSGTNGPDQPGQTGSSSGSSTGTGTNPATPDPTPTTPTGNGGTPKPTPEPQSTHFFLSAPLDNTRINKEIQTILEEVIFPLTSESGVTLSMKFEVEADAAAGFSKGTVRAVSENCQSLKLNFGFD